VILVLSNIADDAADELVKSFPPGHACRITAAELYESFRVGLSVNNFATSRIALCGRDIRVGEISGVVCSIQGFLPQEFYFIDPVDRAYVCAEAGATFIYFLSQLNCRKINPPSTRSFSGPALDPMQWSQLAIECGVAVQPLRVKNGAPVPDISAQSARFASATIIGEHFVGADPSPSVAEALRRLSRRMQLHYLSAAFVGSGDEWMLAGLNAVPDLSNLELFPAIVEFFK
jgi:hypothetical protein